MAELPRATVTLAADGGGVASGSDLVAIFSCTSSGTAGTIGTFSRVQEAVDTYGLGEGLDLAAHLVQGTRKPFMLGKLASATAASVGPVDVTGVTGTSVVTFTGTPTDEESLEVVVVTGGTIGTAGIEIKTSRDGGRTYSGVKRLGTAVAYAIPGTGVTANFAAGTLIADDIARAHCKPAMWNAAGLTALRTALAAQTRLPRLIVLCGDVTSISELGDVIDEINAYETENGRNCRIICSARDRYPDVSMQGAPADVDFDGTAHTITRSTGSWITDGFKDGMSITIDGTASNDATVANVTVTSATVLTFSAGLTTEANLDGADISITGTEPAAKRRTAVEAIIGATPSTAKDSHRTVIAAGRARRKSPLDSSRKRRPASWPIAIRAMSHDLHVSPAKVSLGGLSGWTIHDEDGVLEDHDERVDGGLLGIRAACLTTNDDFSGVFCALPLTLAEDNTPLSRLPIGFVADLACAIVRRETTRRLNEEVILDSTTGYMLDSEKARIEKYVLGQLELALLSKGPEGQRASDVTFEIDSAVDLRTPGAIVSCEGVVTGLGYIERFSTTVRVPGGG